MRAIRVGCLLSLWALVSACADAEPRTALAELKEQQERRDGETVVVQGRVAMTEEPLHYWITDGDFNRVGLRPDSVVEDHVGKRVRVRGRFTYSRDAGRWIRVEDIAVRAELKSE